MAQSGSSVDRSAEVQQTMQRQLSQCGSRLWCCCVLELHNALACSAAGHVPRSQTFLLTVGENSSHTSLAKLFFWS